MENRIKKLLEDIYRETGVMVNGVGVVWRDMSTMDKREYQISCVSLATAKNTDIQ